MNLPLALVLTDDGTDWIRLEDASGAHLLRNASPHISIALDGMQKIVTLVNGEAQERAFVKADQALICNLVRRIGGGGHVNLDEG